MIRYNLVCAAEHGFDSWFRDSAAFDTLAAGGQVTCPSCGSAQVRKALMAPSVVTSRTKAKAAVPPAPGASPPSVPAAPAASPAAPGVPPQPVALIDERAQQLRAALRDIHRRMTEGADDVGRRFAAEARAIHEGEAPARSIYGEATRDEVGALLEDGVPLLPMPVLPDDHH